MFQVLLVENDLVDSRNLKRGLSHYGFEVTVCDNHAQTVYTINQKKFNIILINTSIPEWSGFDLCREIRSINHEIPILLIIKYLNENSLIKGLNQGADDYIRKPFNMDELNARMKWILQRHHKMNQCLQFRSVQIDVPNRLVHVANKELCLGRREFDILTLLVKKSGNVVTRNEVLSALNDNPDIFDRTIDSHLSHLRKKLKTAGSSDISIVPVYGVGYRLRGQ